VFLGIVGLLLHGVVAHADGLGERVVDPFDPSDRLAFAQALAAEPELHEEARDALMGLLRDPKVGAEARVAVADLCIVAEARAGWTDLYRQLLYDRRVPADRKQTLRLRLAEARTDIRGSRGQATSSLRSLVSRHPDRHDYRVSYAHALMAQRQPYHALKQLERTGSYAHAIPGRVYSLIALNRMAEARKLWQERWKGETSPYLSNALTRGTRESRVIALWQAGYPDLAEHMMGREDGTGKYTDGPAWRAIGDLRVSQNRLRAGHWAYRAALEDDPRDSVSRQRLVATLLEMGDLASAEKFAGQDSTAKGMVESVKGVRAATKVENDSARHQVIARSYAQSPHLPEVARAQAAALVEQGRDAEALAAVGPVLARRPYDAAALWTYGIAALDQDKAEIALLAFQQAAQHAPTPKTRDKLTGDLAAYYTAIAGSYKAQQRYLEAVEAQQMALAMRPTNGDYMEGAGGTLWVYGSDLRSQGLTAEGDAALESARDHYLAAWESQQRKFTALVHAAEISLSLGQPETSLELVALADRDDDDLRRIEADARISILLTQAEEVWNAGEHAEARAIYDIIVDTWPDHPGAWHALGDVSLSQNEAEQALGYYERAEALEPSNPWVQIGKAKALASLDPPQLDRAETTLDRIQPRAHDEPDAVRRGVNGARSTVLCAKGSLYRDQGRLREAFEQFAKARDLAPNDPWPSANLAGVYLANGQPGPALGHFGDALVVDSDNEMALEGRFLSLAALGREEEARRALDDIGPGAAEERLRAHLADLQVKAQVAEFDRSGLWSRPEAVHALLADLETEHRGSAEIQAARATLYLKQEQYLQALDAARVALARDPSNGRATAVAMEAGYRGGQMDAAVLTIEGAVIAGGGKSAEAALADAIFMREIEEALERGRRGKLSYAEARLDELLLEATAHTDRLALVAGARLELGDRAGARAVYERALNLNRDHLGSTLGMAATWEAAGQIRRAEELLADAYNRTTHPEIGAALAHLQARRGDWKGAQGTLDLLRVTPAKVDTTGRSREPLPILPLRDGSIPDDPIPADMKARMVRMSAEELAVVERRVLAARGPAADIGGGVLSRTGYRSEGWLMATLGTASLRDLSIGPLALHADALFLDLYDGTDIQQGGAGSIGLTVPLSPGAKLRGRVGTSPVGFDTVPYATWLLEGEFKAEGGSSFSFETSRVPITDSLTSWAGKTSPDGTLFGAVSYSSVGGRMSLRSRTDWDLGVRGAVGFLEGYFMEPVERRELISWGGKRIGEAERWGRLGLHYMAIEHTRQIDAFVPGEAGVFSPDRFQQLTLRVDGGIHPEGRRTGLCGGLMAGVQGIDAEWDTVIAEPGRHPVVGGHATVVQPLTDELSANLSGRYVLVADTWSAQSVMLQLGYRPTLSGLDAVGQISPINGSALAELNECERY